MKTLQRLCIGCMAKYMVPKKLNDFCWEYLYQQIPTAIYNKIKNETFLRGEDLYWNYFLPDESEWDHSDEEIIDMAEECYFHAKYPLKFKKTKRIKM